MRLVCLVLVGVSGMSLVACSEPPETELRASSTAPPHTSRSTLEPALVVEPAVEEGVPVTEPQPVSAVMGAEPVHGVPPTFVEAPSSDPVRLPEVSGRGRVGSHVRVGDSQFMIWGAAKSGVMPKGLSISTDGETLYASSIGRLHRQNIAVYATNPLTFTRYVDYEGSAIETYPSSDGLWLFSTNMYRYGHFDVLDMETLSLQHHIYVPGHPKMIVPNAAGDLIYLSLWNGSAIARLTWPGLEVTRTFLGDVKGGPFDEANFQSKLPRGMALSADEELLYVVNNRARTLSVVATATFEQVRQHYVGHAPRHIAQSADKKTLYISLTGNDAIAVFDTETETVQRQIRVGHRPKGVELSHDGRYLYAGNYLGSSLHIVDLQTDEQQELMLNVLKVSGLAVRPDDQFIYVTGWCTRDVWAIQRLDDGQAPRLPLGYDKPNDPCYTCPSTFTGCPRWGPPAKATTG